MSEHGTVCQSNRETPNYHLNNSGGHSRHSFTGIYSVLTAAAPRDSVFRALGTN